MDWIGLFEKKLNKMIHLTYGWNVTAPNSVNSFKMLYYGNFYLPIQMAGRMCTFLAVHTPKILLFMWHNSSHMYSNAELHEDWDYGDSTDSRRIPPVWKEMLWDSCGDRKCCGTSRGCKRNTEANTHLTVMMLSLCLQSQKESVSIY